MKSSITRHLLALVAATVVSLGATGISHAANADKITVAGWSQPITEITNLLVEPDKGFFKARGLELAYVPGAGGGDAIRNMLTGQAMVAFTDPGSFFAALDKGAKLRAIYDIYPQNVFNVVSLKGSHITKPADLKGKKIGVYSLSSGTRQALLVLLHQAGLSESDVTIVVTGLLNFAPLLQGQVDATAATDTGLLVGRQKGLGDVNVMNVSDYLNIPSDMFVVTEDTYQNKKELLRRFLAAYRDSAAWMIQNPDEAAALAVKRAIDGQDPAINREVIQMRNLSSVSATTRAHGLGAFDMAVMQKAADTYKKLGITQHDFRASDVIRQDLLPQK
ncbi:MAG: nitrate ABC transporter substrate-binding protein [Burkholderiaceae bacterium]|nr:MAG: nitrate ABC transporter substrate-binding protein [Burkholderiaceae bacterium]